MGGVEACSVHVTYCRLQITGNVIAATKTRLPDQPSQALGWVLVSGVFPGTQCLSFLTWMSVCSAEAVPLSAPVRPVSHLCAHPSAEDVGIRYFPHSFLPGAGADVLVLSHATSAAHGHSWSSLASLLGLISLWFSSD